MELSQKCTGTKKKNRNLTIRRYVCNTIYVIQYGVIFEVLNIVDGMIYKLMWLPLSYFTLKTPAGLSAAGGGRIFSHL